MVLQGDYEVTDVLPPPNHEDLHVLIMAVGYMLLFLFGTCGNVAVLTTIYHVVSFFHRKKCNLQKIKTLFGKQKKTI